MGKSGNYYRKQGIGSTVQNNFSSTSSKALRKEKGFTTTVDAVAPKIQNPSVQLADKPFVANISVSYFRVHLNPQTKKFEVLVSFNKDQKVGAPGGKNTPECNTPFKTLVFQIEKETGISEVSEKRLIQIAVPTKNEQSVIVPFEKIFFGELVEYSNIPLVCTKSSVEQVKFIPVEDLFNNDKNIKMIQIHFENFIKIFSRIAESIEPSLLQDPEIKEHLEFLLFLCEGKSKFFI
jgi:hypothetical protein